MIRKPTGKHCVGRGAVIACVLALNPLPALAGEHVETCIVDGGEWGCWSLDDQGNPIEPAWLEEDDAIRKLVSTFRGRGVELGGLSAVQSVLRGQ